MDPLSKARAMAAQNSKNLQAAQAAAMNAGGGKAMNLEVGSKKKLIGAAAGANIVSSKKHGASKNDH